MPFWTWLYWLLPAPHSSELPAVQLYFLCAGWVDVRKLVSLVLHKLSSCHSSPCPLELSLSEVEWPELHVARITAECSLLFVVFLTSFSGFLLLGLNCSLATISGSFSSAVMPGWGSLLCIYSLGYFFLCYFAFVSVGTIKWQSSHLVVSDPV